MMSTIIHVRNYHTDSYGHVNNARYLEFLEEARWQFFNQHGLWQQLASIHLVVTRVDIRYRSAALLGEALQIQSQIADVQTRQVLMEQKITTTDGARLIAIAQVSLMPTQNGKAQRLPEDLLRAITQLKT